MNEHRLMVVGGGNAGRALAAAAAVSGLAEVVAVCDTDESRLRPWVESYPDIQAGTDLAALLRISRPDVAHIASPDHLHFAHAVQALAAGCDLLIEKPLATSAADARKLLAAVEAEGAVALVHFPLRHQYPTREALQAIKRGDLGEPFLLEGMYVHDMWEYYSPASERRTPWRVDPEHPQNVVFGGGCHPIDLMLETIGQPVEIVSAFSRSSGSGVFPADDVYVASMRFRGGPVGQLLVSTGVNGVSFPLGYFNAYGPQGAILKDKLSRRGEPNRALERPADDPAGGHNWAAAIRGFIQTVEGLRPPPAPLAMAAANVAVCEAVVRSAATGRPVQVERFDPWHPWGDFERAQLKMRYSKGIDGLPDWDPPPGYSVRAYRRADDRALRELLLVAGFPWKHTEEGFRVLIEQDEAVTGTRVIEHGGEIVAVTFGGKWSKEIGRLDYVCGHPDHRGKGLGIGVCVAALRYLLEAGYESVDLSTDDWRIPAIRTYLKVGFEPLLHRGDMEGRWKKVFARLGRRK